MHSEVAMNDIPVTASNEAAAFVTALSVYVGSDRQFETVGFELATMLDDRQRQRLVHLWQGFVAGRKMMGSS